VPEDESEFGEWLWRAPGSSRAGNSRRSPSKIIFYHIFRVADPYTGSGAFLTPGPGSGIGFFPDLNPIFFRA
jgi:hypothetical protein